MKKEKIMTIGIKNRSRVLSLIALSMITLSSNSSMYAGGVEAGGIESAASPTTFGDRSQAADGSGPSIGGENQATQQAALWWIIPSVWDMTPELHDILPGLVDPVWDGYHPSEIPPPLGPRACWDLTTGHSPHLSDPYRLIKRIFERAYPPITDGELDEGKWIFICARIYEGIRKGGEGSLVPRENFREQRLCLATLYAELGCRTYFERVNQPSTSSAETAL
jgi:hypothetical protein